MEWLWTTQWLLVLGDKTSSDPKGWSSVVTDDPSPEQEDLAQGSTVTLDLTAGTFHADASDEVAAPLMRQYTPSSPYSMEGLALW